jgi:hypothetical protein
LLPSLPYQAPKFPSFAELVEQDRNQHNSRGTKREGLFSALVNDPRVLWLDLLDSPEKYEDGVSDLIQDLVSGQKRVEELNQEEASLLDRAVLDFSRPTPPRAPPPPVKVPQLKPRDHEPDTVEEQRTELPPEMANAYWWLK